MTCRRFLPTYGFDDSLGYGRKINLTSLSQYNSNVHPVSFADILGYLDLYCEDQDGSSISINRVTAAISRQLLPPIYKAIRNKGAGAIASYLLASKIITDRELIFWLGKCLVEVMESVRNPQRTPEPKTIRRPDPRLRCRSRSDNR